MRYKEFGSTGKKLSVFGFGGAKFRNGKSVEENAQRVVYAFEKGVNHFDSNAGYTDSEAVFSLAMRNFKRNEYFMSTKNQPFFVNSKAEAKDGIKRSLDNMKLDYFDFYYFWNVKKIDEYYKTINISDHYEALLEAKSEGLISHIALASHLTGKEAIEIIDDGKIDGILLNLNILNFPYTIDAAVHAKKKGIGVGAMSPLYGGQIPQNEEKLRFLSLHDLSPTNEALRFISGLECIDYAYVGFRSNEEIDNACRIADMNTIIPDSEIDEITKLIGSGLDKACTGCMYCMEYCSKQLPIAEYMTYYNQKYLFGMPQEDFEKRLAFHKDWFMLAKRKADAKDCIKCGKCEKQCTQHINIMERIAEIAEIEARI
ncbi:MAG: aldo/keto reductase [Saccharofermentanales bacterium]